MTFYPFRLTTPSSPTKPAHDKSGANEDPPDVIRTQRGEEVGKNFCVVAFLQKFSKQTLTRDMQNFPTIRVRSDRPCDLIEVFPRQDKQKPLHRCQLRRPRLLPCYQCPSIMPRLGRRQRNPDRHNGRVPGKKRRKGALWLSR